MRHWTIAARMEVVQAIIIPMDILVMGLRPQPRRSSQGKRPARISVHLFGCSHFLERSVGCGVCREMQMDSPQVKTGVARMIASELKLFQVRPLTQIARKWKTHELSKSLGRPSRRIAVLIELRELPIPWN